MVPEHHHACFQLFAIYFSVVQGSVCAFVCMCCRCQSHDVACDQLLVSHEVQPYGGAVSHMANVTAVIP